MQAPATPLSFRHGPFEQDNNTSAADSLAMGLSTSFAIRWAVLSTLSTVRPRDRPRGPRGGGIDQDTRGTCGSLRSSSVPAPAVSRARSYRLRGGTWRTGRRDRLRRQGVVGGLRRWRAGRRGIGSGSSSLPWLREPLPDPLPRRAHENARRNQSIRRSVDVDASTGVSVPTSHGP
jgi:hypothetical protein